MRSSLTILLVLGLIVVCHGRAESAGITVDFSGTLVSAGTPFSVGEGFSGSYTFDSTVSPTGLVPGNNEAFNPLTAFTVTLGSYTASFSSATPAGGLFLTHNVSATDAFGKSFTADGYQVNVTAGAGVSAASVNGLPLFTINLVLLDPTHSAFSTFPSTPPTPQFCALSCEFTDSNFSMEWSTLVEGGSILFIIGAITSLTVQTSVTTPEPSTWLLLASGLVGLVLWRRKRTA